MALTKARDDVAEFMGPIGHAVRETPAIPTWGVKERDAASLVARMARNVADYARVFAKELSSEQTLRMSLVAEEMAELFEAIAADDLVGIGDGTTDLMYVTVGTQLTFGLPSAAMWDEVHRSNMSKFAGGQAILDSAGKLVKGPGFSPANIRSVLDAKKAGLK